MDDLISRSDVIDALDTAIEHYDGIAEECRKKADIERNDYMDMRDDAYEARQLAQWLNELKYLREKVEQLTIKPELHEGEWVNGRCNKCGGHAPFWAMASTYYESNYCPNCGADMRGEQHETD